MKYNINIKLHLWQGSNFFFKHYIILYYIILYYIILYYIILYYIILYYIILYYIILYYIILYYIILYYINQKLRTKLSVILLLLLLIRDCCQIFAPIKIFACLLKHLYVFLLGTENIVRGGVAIVVVVCGKSCGKICGKICGKMCGKIEKLSDWNKHWCDSRYGHRDYDSGDNKTKRQNDKKA